MEELTLAVSYFKDCKDREHNYQKFIDHYVDMPFKIDIEVCDKYVPLMKIYNKIAKRCSTKYIAFIDIDCIIDEQLLIRSIEKLKTHDHFINPFNKIYNVKNNVYEEHSEQLKNMPQPLHGNFLFEREATKTFGRDKLNKTTWEESFTFSAPFFVGLCVVTELKTFFDFGMGNENYVTWGMADEEWYIRATKLGYNWSNINGTAYHLHHEYITPPKARLWRVNVLEHYKILSLNKDDLKDYIDTWSWTIR